MEGFNQNYSKKIGILITNLGTPDEPNKKSLKKYLREFLSDNRVIDYNRVLWYIILHGIILNTRPKKSAKLYKKIWTKKGSPLMVHMTDIVDKLQTRINQKNLHIELGMRYGNPSLKTALEKFKKNNVMKILVIPLYPQAGSPTSSSTFDKINNILSKWPWVPNMRFMNGYHDRQDYIMAIQNTMNSVIPKISNVEMIIFSFHGMPFRYLKEGDPYYCFCHKTARLIAQNLKLDEKNYSLAFQSRFGREEWLQPYIDEEIINFAKNGVKTLHVISPGFSVDCLETLEEIQIQYSELFKQHGGKELVYIPCLNSNEDQINMIQSMVNENIGGW
tara:strand:- start:356 stop:1351 length:996 start_codon:yes stop_codon:yes gene_type:complete